ncbi:MAG: hypothetical protein CMG71_00255 [Candidatus Marinimicrobia bacterium]|nr:hypothetical protein [Candidatus Neomarinimicrobiota bacterium]|tara:strand:- start:27489 stop:28208 length:720 start_codon:yes stop_codon:yes gene_type:complete
MTIFNTLRGVWIVLNMVVAFLLLAPIDIFLSVVFRKRRPWFLTWLWSKWVFTLSGLRYELEGEENLTPGESYVFMSNHTHEADIALLYMALKRDIIFIIKQEFRKVPFAGWYAALKGHVFIDRSNSTKAQLTLRRIAKSFKQTSRSLVIFPEGTYFKDGEIRPFRPGGVVLAIETEMKIVPVAIRSKANIDNVIITGTRKNPLKVIIGQPFSIAEFGYPDRYEVANRIRQAVLDLMKNT